MHICLVHCILLCLVSLILAAQLVVARFRDRKKMPRFLSND